MTNSDSEQSKVELTQAIEERKNAIYRLRLFISGSTERSSRAIANLRSICDEHLPGRYELEVVDLYQQPELAREGKVLAAPTLVKELPEPVRRIVGDMSDEQRVLVGLDIVKLP